jgi:branched-chain amino acid transport system substrate-binding protein
MQDLVKIIGTFWMHPRAGTAAALCLAACLAFLCVSCDKPAATNREDHSAIKIGEFASLTGKEATFGMSSHNATMLAIDEINASGGVLGKKLHLSFDDDQSKAGEAATVVRKLISRDQVVAILGEVASSRSLEAAPIAQASKIPMISPSSTNPKVTETGDHIFRVCFTDKFQGRVLADFARNTLKASKAAILVDLKSDYSQGLAQYFTERFVGLGGQVLAERNYSGGDKDFKSQLTAIKAIGPEVIMIPGYYTDVGLIALQAQQLGMKTPMIGGDGWESPKLLEIAGDAVEGHYFSTHYSAEAQTPLVDSFVKAYQAKYGAAPDALAALGYDSVLVLVDALKRAGKAEPGAIRDALAATKNVEAVSGRISMDAERNPTKPAVILTVQKGRFKLVETIQP